MAISAWALFGVTISTGPMSSDCVMCRQSSVARCAILWIRQFGIKFRTYPVRFVEESFDYQIADFRPFHCMSGARVYDARFIRDRSHGWI